MLCTVKAPALCLPQVREDENCVRVPISDLKKKIFQYNALTSKSVVTFTFKPKERDKGNVTF